MNQVNQVNTAINSTTISQKASTCVLIVNLGTPDSPSVSDVRKYLREFLMDKRVVDVPVVLRWLLVNLIIAPFRSPKSAKVYKEVWTPEGSPLKVNGFAVEKLLQEALPDDYEVHLAMRYQSPSLDGVLKEIYTKNFKKIIIIPMFPQYASASTGSVTDKVMEIVAGWQIIPEIQFMQSFYQDDLFIKAFVEIGKKYIKEHDYDHFLFSYHGLPERQIRKGDCTNTCLKPEFFPNGKQEAGCCSVLETRNQSCYRAACFETTRLIIKDLGLPEDKCTTSFQSRLGNDIWIKPYTDDVIKQLAKEGKKKVLAFSPAFVSDCLETTIEVAEEYKELFEEYGGEHWQLVESLNTSEIWIECLRRMVLKAN
jgi:protoporphyrin/coproporphyrin ferrochelatase